ncbi:MAG TPA: 2OG-Fe(II) oxygenase family protein [Sphingomicrobium sp.]|nr:2OG-Fe(II) oxygenase family protein [Sphingomicrobium sp.]
MKINPNHDVASLAKELAERRRLQVRDMFDSRTAEEIHRLLVEETPWWLVYNIGDRVEQIPPEQLARLHPEQAERIFSGVVDRARTQYQFVYAAYPMVAPYFNPNLSQAPILRLFEFLNTAPVLDWFRRLTGREDIQWIDGQATLYQSGHFLKSHSDRDEENTRAAAYVLNFTRVWERDWGGYLQFFNDDHDIELALRPIFNAMNIFLVPTDHSVGVVAPFAGGDRLSVTGWLRTNAPPGPFGRIAL